MRRFLALPLIVAVGLGLAGCTAPLTKDDISVSITVGQTTDVIIGDVSNVSATANFADDRSDEVDVSLEVSVNGGPWEVLAEDQLTGPKVSIAGSNTQEVAGPVEYRVSFSEAGKTDKPIVTAKSEPIKVIDLPQLVRTFFYDGTNAWAVTTADGLQWENDHLSPELDKLAPTWVANNADLLAANYTESMVPDLGTIAPDLEWTIPATDCNPAGTEPPAGRTFIVGVTFGSIYNGFVNPPTAADVHVTLLDGKLYDYRC